MRSPIPLLVLLLALGGAGCSLGHSGDEGREAIPRDTFVAAYYQLRVAALESPGEVISVETRDSILDALGLTEEDLLQFVEVRGRNADLMKGVWEQVDSLMRENRNRADAGGGGDNRP